MQELMFGLLTWVTLLGSALANQDICSEAASAGPCRAIHIRWYFNQKTNDCETFLFGGCQSNQNNFASRDECVETCKPDLVDLCSQAKAIGPCRGALPRFWYNMASKRCEQFVFGGCRSNQNNFLDADQCVANCSALGVDFLPTGRPSLMRPRRTRGQQKTCRMVKTINSGCNRQIGKFYFNHTSTACEKLFTAEPCYELSGLFGTLVDCKLSCGH